MTGTQDKMSNHIFQTNEIIDDNTHKKKSKNPRHTVHNIHIFIFTLFTPLMPLIISVIAFEKASHDRPLVFFIFVMA